jgi:hypothetical protein
MMNRRLYRCLSITLALVASPAAALAQEPSAPSPDAPSVFAAADDEQPVAPARPAPPAGYGTSPAGRAAPRGPTEMDDLGGDIPDGYVLESRINKGLVIAGASVFGGVYLLTCMGAAIAHDESSNPEQFDPLFIPVAGPFVTIHTADANATGTFGLVIDGLAQTAGLSMFIAGLAAQEDVLVWRGSYGQTVRPEAGPGGASVVGTF